VLVVGVNILGVRVFGELESVMASIKISECRGTSLFSHASDLPQSPSRS